MKNNEEDKIYKKLKKNEELEELLKKTGMNMAELARKVGLGPATVHEVFTGVRKDIKISTALKIADELGIEVRELYNIMRGES